MPKGPDGQVGPIAKLVYGAAAGTVAQTGISTCLNPCLVAVLCLASFVLIRPCSCVYLCAVTFPFDTIRRRLMMQGYKRPDGTTAPVLYRGFLHGFTTILKKEGPRGLFAGLFVNWLKVMPTMAVTFYVYEWCKPILGMSSSGSGL